MNRISIFLVFLVFVMPGHAQDAGIQALLERLSEQEENTPAMEVLYEQLETAMQQPLDINKAGIAELMELPFVDENLAREIYDHRTSSGPYQSLLELQVLDHINPDMYLLLKTVLTCKRILHDVNEGRRMELLVYGYRAFPLSDEYATGKADPYLGPAWRNAFRLRWKLKENLELGIGGEKDAGEPFRGNFMGADHSGGYLHYRSGRLQLVVGDFTANFGQGLTMASSGIMSKSSQVLQLKKNGSGFRPYRTWNEGSYFRGIAAEWLKDDFSCQYFVSFKQGDASLDSTGNILSRPVSGLHRTTKERSEKNNLWLMTMGARVAWGKRHFRIGLNAVKHHEVGKREHSPLREWLYHSEVVKTGIDYRWNFQNLQAFGEITAGKSGAFAVLSGCILSLGKRVDLGMVFRKYGPGFPADFSSAFSEFSGNSNETGMYVSAAIVLNPRCRLSFSSDLFSRPEISYRSDFPQRGRDALAELSYRKSKRTGFYIRYQENNKERNRSGNETNLPVFMHIRRQSLRFNGDHSISEALKFCSRIELCSFAGEQNERGILFYQDLTWKPMEKSWQLLFRFSVFRVSGYNARVYAYENDVLYTYLVPAYSGNGSRYYMVVKQSLGRNCDLWIKYSASFFEDTDAVSNSPYLQEKNSKQELKLQLRVQF